MSPDIRRLLADTAQPPLDPIDPDAIHARGRRRRAGQWVAGTAGGVVVIALAVVLGQQFLPEATPSIDEVPSPSQPLTPDPIPSPTVAPSPAGDPSASPSDATASPMPTLLVLEQNEGENDRIRFVSPDGSEEVLELATEHVADFHPDGFGGVVYQADYDWQEGTPVLHTSRDGSTRTLVEAKTWPEFATLLGVDRSGGAILEIGVKSPPEDATGDLVVFPFDGSTPTLVVSEAGGWEYGTIEATGALGTYVYWTHFSVGGEVVAARPEGARNTLITVNDAIDVIRGIAMSPEGTPAAVLVDGGGTPETTDARLAFISGLLTGPSDVSSLPVPMGLGLDDPAVPAAMSWHGDVVLVNRWDLDTWFRPLVYDRSTENWSVLDVEGLVRFGD